MIYSDYKYLLLIDRTNRSSLLYQPKIGSTGSVLWQHQGSVDSSNFAFPDLISNPTFWSAWYHIIPGDTVEEIQEKTFVELL